MNPAMARRLSLAVALAACVGSFGHVLIAADAPAHSAVTPAPRKAPPSWMARHEAMNAQVKQGNVDLLMIGDSITHGWERGGKQLWAEHYAKRNAVNLGISGDRTQHVLWRLQNGNIEGIHPKLAVIMIGTNNAGDNTADETAEGITAIVKLLRKELPDTQVLLLAIFPRGQNSKDAKRIKNEQVNAMIAKLDDGDHVHYLDIGGAFLKKDGTLPKSLMPDLLHPNAEGYRVWAEAIEPHIQRLMGEGAPAMKRKAAKLPTTALEESVACDPGVDECQLLCHRF